MITIKAARAASRASNTSDSAPAGFDATNHPIISRHFFGVEPFRPIGEAASNVPSSLRRQRQIGHVFGLGLRAVSELLHEVDAGADLDSALAAYCLLTPELLLATGGDRIPPAPIHEVS